MVVCVILGSRKSMKLKEVFKLNRRDDNASICSEEMPEILNFTADETLRHPHHSRPFVVLPSCTMDSDDDSEYDDEYVNIECETESDHDDAENESIAEDESFEAF
ncbi:5339_t:CDS:1, partial [Paraglomus occultum]